MPVAAPVASAPSLSVALPTTGYDPSTAGLLYMMSASYDPVQALNAWIVMGGSAKTLSPNDMTEIFKRLGYSAQFGDAATLLGEAMKEAATCQHLARAAAATQDQPTRFVNEQTNNSLSISNFV